MVFNFILAQRYRPEWDDIEPTPIWINVLILGIILIYLWWNNSKRICEYKGLTIDDFRTKCLNVIKYFFLDMRDAPWVFIIGIGILVLYTIILMYEWTIYILIIVGLIIYFICDKYSKYKQK